MNKLIILLSFCIIISSCGCKRAIRSENEVQQVSNNLVVLHPKIIDAIKEFQSNAPTDRIYAVYFTDTNNGFTMLKQDTIIYLSFLEEHPLINVNYKGILNVDSLSVAIFDKNSCGNNFYDSTKLSPVSLSDLKKTPKHEIKPVAAWGVQADSIIRWVAP